MTYPYFTTGNCSLTFYPSATIGNEGHDIIIIFLPGAIDNKIVRILSAVAYRWEQQAKECGYLRSPSTDNEIEPCKWKEMKVSALVYCPAL